LAKLLTLLATAAALMAWVDKDAQSVLARRNWWAFQKPVRAPLPAVSSDFTS
jgi:hypothetical protein